ncbi:hypothetical protein [Olleya sp. Bg11-27]|uniref:hypothetical protein n=1 Tax=Olleya sp. Bg11-27 TaxID=2058135 RepID=UPI000C316C6D|nr:hypothetical protein [Olleya sp. Bg11-27]AUC76079.1 hypothetical protein CW732_10560 [Olleya sp. Bg11-27]
MKNIFALILYLNFTIGFSQNSELFVLKEIDTLKSSDFGIFIKTEDGIFKLNKSRELYYDNMLLENEDIISILVISKIDTLNFNLNKKQKLTFEKDGSEYKTLSLSFNGNTTDSNFDFELCKKRKSDIIIHFANKNFNRVYSELIIGMENPKGKYDKETTSKYNIRKKKKEFRKRKRELKTYFKESDFTTIEFGNNIFFE